MDSHQVHGFRHKSTGQTNIDRSLLAVTSEYPDLITRSYDGYGTATNGETHFDTSLLESVDRIGHAVLKLVLDGGCSQQKHILLNDFGGFVERFTSAIDSSSSLVVHLGPGLILRVRYFAHCKAQCSETLRRVLLRNSRKSYYNPPQESCFVPQGEPWLPPYKVGWGPDARG